MLCLWVESFFIRMIFSQSLVHYVINSSKIFWWIELFFWSLPVSPPCFWSFQASRTLSRAWLTVGKFMILLRPFLGWCYVKKWVSQVRKMTWRQAWHLNRSEAKPKQPDKTTTSITSISTTSSRDVSTTATRVVKLTITGDFWLYLMMVRCNKIIEFLFKYN